MKKTVITVSLLFASFICFSQKDSLKDTIAVLSFPQVNEIMYYMNLAKSGRVDVKGETWTYLMNMIGGSLQERKIPKKEQPKK